MSWEIDEPPPTPEELAEARALAESLEEGRADALGPAAAIRLLREEPAGAADELARIRLRRTLVAAASPRRRVLRHVLALAASLLLAGGLGALLLHRPAPTDETLARREDEARASIERLLAGRTSSTPVNGVSRVASALVAARQESLLSSFTRERTATLLGSSASPNASPTPGGRS